MNSITQCLECGSEIPANAKGLCPKCMLKLGLASQFGAVSVASAGARALVPPPLMPFEFGEYRVLRLLGRGGMGAVYEAEQRESGRRVALKVLGHSIDSPEMRKRFLREGRLAAAVNHPNTVYIYGTEEIDETPVIAMEIVAGGTLKDEVKRRGPLPVRDAVNAILHIVDGLEAAQAGGVLHRDIKPSNCFVGADGTVKVGDFGLSISTLARGDSQVTASGVMLGTPSFAAPEQLRGDELDLRADVYSVGATLYYLLTAKAPHEGENVVNVVAAVLDKAPRPIPEFRKDVPAGLTQIIGRCLAKKRDERFASYAELRDALLPYSSATPEPAPIGLRVLAQVIDSYFATLPAIVLLIFTGGDFAHQWLSERTLTAALQWFGAFAFYVAYYTVLEGVWGAGVGKGLCGLRVNASGRGAPGLACGAVRAFIWALLMNGATFLQLAFTSPPEFGRIAREGTSIMDWSGALFLALTFITARRRNSFAGLHELASGTRVVKRPRSEVRSPVPARPSANNLESPSSSSAAAAIPEHAETVGPYRVLGPIGGAWLLGDDEVLRRHVWIRRSDPATPALPPSRRDLGRAGRLRWLGGARGNSTAWDAFDAPVGNAFLDLVAQPQPWSTVRYWLYDLAEEIDAAMKDGTLPAQIGLDCVWVTAQGRAVLLDEPWPLVASAPRFACADAAGAQRFLDAVANVALDRSQLPLHARTFLRNLAAGALERTSFIVGNLRSLLSKPASVMRRRRFASIGAAAGLALVFSTVIFLFMTMQLYFRNAAWTTPPSVAQLPDLIHLYTAVREETSDKPLRFKDAKTNENPELAENLGIYIAGHFGEFIRSAEFERHPGVARLSKKERDLVRATVEAHPQVTPERLTAADAKVKDSVEMFCKVLARMEWVFGLSMFVVCMGAVAVLNLLCVVASGTPANLRILGLAVVNSAGEPASRLRMIGRTALVWLPLSIAVTAFILFRKTLPFPMQVGVAIATSMIFLAGVVWSVVRPTRGLHDLLIGSHVVAR